MSTGRTLEVADRRVWLLDEGRGTPVLYLHGFGDVHGAVADWFAFHEALAASFRVVAPAHPGCASSSGMSDIDGVEDLVFHYLDVLDALGLSQVDVVGACLGGWIAAELAVRHRQRIRRLVLMDAPGLHVPGSPIADVFMLAQRRDWGKHDDLRRLLFRDPEGKLALGLFPDGAAPVADELLRYQCLTLAARIGWTPPYLYDRKLRSRLRRIGVPTLVVWGRDDRFVPVAHAHAYADGIAGAAVSLLEAGHSPWLELPEVCAAAVAQFLRRP